MLASRKRAPSTSTASLRTLDALEKVRLTSVKLGSDVVMEAGLVKKEPTSKFGSSVVTVERTPDVVDELAVLSGGSCARSLTNGLRRATVSGERLPDLALASLLFLWETCWFMFSLPSCCPGLSSMSTCSMELIVALPSTKLPRPRTILSPLCDSAMAVRDWKWRMVVSDMSRKNCCSSSFKPLRGVLSKTAYIPIRRPALDTIGTPA